MESLSRYKKRDNAILRGLIRIGDLSYFEGPLLTLFENPINNYLYVCDWVDRDSKTNRWIIYRVKPDVLYSFIKGRVSHLDLFERRCEKNIFIVDIENNGRYLLDGDLKESSFVPDAYYPDKNDLFDIDDCLQYEKIESRIVDLLSVSKQKNEYQIGYKLNLSGHCFQWNKILNVRKIKNIYQHSSDYETVGNFQKSHMDSYNSLIIENRNTALFVADIKEPVKFNDYAE